MSMKRGIWKIVFAVVGGVAGVALGLLLRRYGSA